MKSTLTGRISRNYCLQGTGNAVAVFYPKLTSVIRGGGTSPGGTSPGGTTTAGAVTITVSGGNITGAIYARGQLDGDTTGAANVIFTGSDGFDCDVFGYSYVDRSFHHTANFAKKIAKFAVGPATRPYVE